MIIINFLLCLIISLFIFSSIYSTYLCLKGFKFEKLYNTAAAHYAFIVSQDTLDMKLSKEEILYTKLCITNALDEFEKIKPFILGDSDDLFGDWIQMSDSLIQMLYETRLLSLNC